MIRWLLRKLFERERRLGRDEGTIRGYKQGYKAGRVETENRMGDGITFGPNPYMEQTYPRFGATVYTGFPDNLEFLEQILRDTGFDNEDSTV